MLDFTLKYWAARVPGAISWLDANPANDQAATNLGVSSLPAMLRRRLSPLGRLAVSAALDILPAGHSIPVVFASRHGDAAKTLELLQALVRGEVLSPTAFSLSVHNAVAGVLSIIRGDISSVTAIAATENLLLFTLIEAAAQLQDVPRILCILCDAPLPEFYRVPASVPGGPLVLAMLLERPEEKNSGGLPRYRLEHTKVTVPQGESVSVLDLLPLLQGEINALPLESGTLAWVLVRQGEVR